MSDVQLFFELVKSNKVQELYARLGQVSQAERVRLVNSTESHGINGASLSLSLGFSSTFKEFISLKKIL